MFENEQTKKDFNLTALEQQYLGLTQKYGLIIPFTNETRQLYITKLYRRALMYMDNISFPNRHDKNKIYTDSENWGYKLEKPKINILTYSAHDNQIANILSFFIPNYNYTDIPYAANIYFELRINNQCIKTQINQ